MLHVLNARAVQALVSQHMDVLEQALVWMCRRPTFEEHPGKAGGYGYQDWVLGQKEQSLMAKKSKPSGRLQSFHLLWGSHGLVALAPPSDNITVTISKAEIRQALKARGWTFKKTKGTPSPACCRACPNFLVCTMEAWIDI